MRQLALYGCCATKTSFLNTVQIVNEEAFNRPVPPPRRLADPAMCRLRKRAAYPSTAELGRTSS